VNLTMLAGDSRGARIGLSATYYAPKNMVVVFGGFGLDQSAETLRGVRGYMYCPPDAMIKFYIGCTQGNGVQQGQCSPCPPGQYQPYQAGQLEIVSTRLLCVACPPGTYSNVTGSEFCVACPKGMLSGWSRLKSGEI